MESILIIGDDMALCSMLRAYFALQNMDLAVSDDEVICLDAVRSGRFDRILLNIKVSGSDRDDVLRRPQPVSDLKVLLLRSTGQVDDSNDGPELSANDYVLQPFNLRELVAHIQAFLRRRTKFPAQAVPGELTGKLSVHGFHLDTMARCAHYRGSLLALTGAEFALLEALLEAPGVVLGRAQLADRISQRPFHPQYRSLDMLVSRLRRKLEIEDNPGAAIRTIRNSGYVFSVPHSE